MSNAKKMEAVLQLQSELTDKERADLARWEAVNCGQGGKSTSDWPGWVDVAMRVAGKNSTDLLKRVSDYSYFLAVVLVYFSVAWIMIVGLLDMQKFNEIAERNLIGFAQVIFLLMFLHAFAKLPVFRKRFTR
ncbi:hypothetical protein [Shigella flexneri]|uniref:hypothetical protein n=1 Tax=Shigella flexneri TaxID=623 RepID=UPI003CEA5CBB|nr:hypothetical protein [Escherichia coli]